MRVVTDESGNSVMEPRVTLAAYLKADARAVLVLCGFALAFFVVLAVIASRFYLENGIDQELAIFIAISSAPLTLFAAVLLDILLMVRRINRAIGGGRLQWGVVSRVAGLDSFTCIVEIVLSRERRGSRRRAFLLSGLRTRSIRAGSKVVIAMPSLSFLRNPIPLNLLLDNSALTRLIGETKPTAVEPRDVGFELPARRHRAKSWVILCLVLLGVATTMLAAPLIFWIFRAAGESFRVIYYPVIFLLSILIPFAIWFCDYVQVRPEGPRILNRKGSPRVVFWGEIQQVVEKSIIGMGHLDILTDDAAVEGWIPLYLHDLEGFLEDVIRLAPEGNPLRREAEELLARRRSLGLLR